MFLKVENVFCFEQFILYRVFAILQYPINLLTAAQRA